MHETVLTSKYFLTLHIHVPTIVALRNLSCGAMATIVALRNLSCGASGHYSGPT